MRKEYEQHRDEEVNTVNKYKIIMEKYFFRTPKKLDICLMYIFTYLDKIIHFQDPERVEQIMERAVMDADWVVKKYAKKS